MMTNRQRAAMPESVVPRSELWIYRDRTLGLLRRYGRVSVEVGRIPAQLGREFFRTRVTSYKMRGFEDGVIFVHDMERCLERIDAFAREALTRVALQEFTQAEASQMMGYSASGFTRKFADAVDTLSDVLLRYGLLETMDVAAPKKPAGRACQAQRRAVSVVNW